MYLTSHDISKKRIGIYFGEKPIQKNRKILKRSGFVYDNRLKLWCANETEETAMIAKQVVSNQLKGMRYPAHTFYNDD